MLRKYEPKFTIELNAAIEVNNTEKIEKLLENFDDKSINLPDTKDFEKRRPIDVVAESGTSEALELLLKRNVDLKSMNNQLGEYPLHILARRKLKKNEETNFIDLIKKFVELGANFNVQKAITKQTPLHVAIAQNNIDIMVKALFEAGVKPEQCDINAEDVDGQTILKTLVDKYSSRPDLIELVYSLGGNVSNKGAVEIAKTLNHSYKLKPASMLDILLENMTAEDIDAQYAIHKAAEDDRVYKIAKLVAQGGSLSLQDENGLTPLDIAFNCNNLFILLNNDVVSAAIERDLEKICANIKPETKQVLAKNPKFAKPIERLESKNKAATEVTLQQKTVAEKKTPEKLVATSLPAALSSGKTTQPADKKLVEAIVKYAGLGNKSLYEAYMKKILGKNDLLAEVLEGCRKVENPKNKDFLDGVIKDLSGLSINTSAHQSPQPNQ